jgi:plasmid stabilization system protein ParE
MDREVIWSLSASDDLVAIAEYISRDSEIYAAVVVRELVAAARSLNVLAERGRQGS